jgi:hypothetical protein
MATRKGKRWSHRVTEKSNALNLEQGVFAKDDPRFSSSSVSSLALRVFASVLVLTSERRNNSLLLPLLSS